MSGVLDANVDFAELPPNSELSVIAHAHRVYTYIHMYTWDAYLGFAQHMDIDWYIGCLFEVRTTLNCPSPLVRTQIHIVGYIYIWA